MTLSLIYFLNLPGHISFCLAELAGAVGITSGWRRRGTDRCESTWVSFIPTRHLIRRGGTWRASSHLRLSSHLWGLGGVGDREGSDLRCVGNQITEMTLSDFQSSVEELLKTEFPKLILSYIGSMCQRGANFSTGKVLLFPVQPRDALANIT